MRIKTYNTICLACGYRGDIKNRWWNFPGSSVVKASPSNAGGAALIPDRAATIPHALWPKKKRKENPTVAIISAQNLRLHDRESETENHMPKTRRELVK